MHFWPKQRWCKPPEWQSEWTPHRADSPTAGWPRIPKIAGCHAFVSVSPDPTCWVCVCVEGEPPNDFFVHYTPSTSQHSRPGNNQSFLHSFSNWTATSSASVFCVLSHRFNYTLNSNGKDIHTHHITRCSNTLHRIQQMLVCPRCGQVNAILTAC